MATKATGSGQTGIDAQPAVNDDGNAGSGRRAWWLLPAIIGGLALWAVLAWLLWG